LEVDVDVEMLSVVLCCCGAVVLGWAGLSLTAQRKDGKQETHTHTHKHTHSASQKLIPWMMWGQGMTPTIGWVAWMLDSGPLLFNFKKFGLC
jgi:hypothetical protein